MKNINKNEREYLYNLNCKLDKDGHTLLYLCRFGSHLYGTNNENSDADFKGVFLPNQSSCLLGKAPKHYTYSTGDRENKNSKDDLDVQLWSLQYWLELVAKGETNALDLLYSFTYPEMIVYESDGMKTVFDNHNRLFTTQDCNSYVGYAVGQAKKYGVKGSRMGVIKKVLEVMELYRDADQACLADVIESIMYKCEDASYCFLKDIKSSNGEMRPYLVLCGSKHELTIGVGEFYNRVKSTYDRYGDRAKAAEHNEGIDWKALSHALRAIVQMIELLNNGKIQYPLISAPYLKRVKRGEYTWKEVETMIVEGLDKIDSLRQTCNPLCEYDSEFAKHVVLDFYKVS